MFSRWDEPIADTVYVETDPKTASSTKSRIDVGADASGCALAESLVWPLGIILSESKSSSTWHAVSRV